MYLLQTKMSQQIKTFVMDNFMYHLGWAIMSKKVFGQTLFWKFL